MTDDKGAGEGPYKHSDYHRTTRAHAVSCLACAYAAGRKAAEKDFHYDELSLKYLVDRHESLVDAFKELLSIAEMMCDDIDYGSDGTAAFVDWKKARGIE